jgi:DNA-binding response OmpR family regulator
MSVVVLIVEDEDKWRGMLGRIVKREGYEPMLARSYEEAIDLLESQTLDIAILDLRLPDLGGRDWLALPELVSKQQIPVIISTGQGESVELARRAFRELSIVDYIFKSDFGEGEQLVTALRRAALNRRQLQAKSLRRVHLTISVLSDGRLFLTSRGGYNADDDCGQFNVNEQSREAWRRRANNIGVFLTHHEVESRKEWRFEAKQIGTRLFDALFTSNPTLYGHFMRAKRAAPRKRDVSICFETPRSLLGLPFELLFDDGEEEYLALEHPLFRAVTGVTCKRTEDELISRLGDQRKSLRILLVASNTEPPRIDGVDGEIDDLRGFLDSRLRAARTKTVTVVPTEKATFECALELFRASKYHVIHYAGHGRFRERYPEKAGMLFWERESRQGSVLPLNADALKSLLVDSENVLFLFLNSCLSASAAGPDKLLDQEFLGVLDAVVQAGVPAVLAHRWHVSDESAPVFAKCFYESLIDKLSLEDAILDARRGIAVNSEQGRNDETWASPVLIVQPC